jgi:hypothetical protein
VRHRPAGVGPEARRFTHRAHSRFRHSLTKVHRTSILPSLPLLQKLAILSTAAVTSLAFLVQLPHLHSKLAQLWLSQCDLAVSDIRVLTRLRALEVLIFDRCFTAPRLTISPCSS